MLPELGKVSPYGVYDRTRNEGWVNVGTDHEWNAIEHRMFSHITQNWRGRPLISHEAIVNLIANTTTKAGLTIQC